MLDVNARLAFAPATPYAATVASLHCTRNGRSEVGWQGADGARDTLKVGDDVCARLALGTHLRAEHTRGALGMSFVRVYRPGVAPPDP